jgi:quercetin dioxygenase-like cupin family protein
MNADLVRIANGLDVAPALAQLALCGEYWIELGEAVRQINLLDHDRGRLLEAELGNAWSLIDSIVEAEAAKGRGVKLGHARIGLMKPGERLPPHFDGIDGTSQRRYQIALVSEEGVAFTLGGETRRFLPGEAWWINAAIVHSVVNMSMSDRITILFDTVTGG